MASAVTVGAPAPAPAPAATKAAQYSPSLDPAELRAAAQSCYRAEAAVGAEARAADGSRAALAATGFAGQSADLALARVGGYATTLRRRADTLRAMGDALDAAARAQESLDALAHAALLVGQYRVILWLNQLSQQLDTELARELNRTRGRGMERLAECPQESLGALSARHTATLPASTRRTIEAAGGLVLEVGPGSTTVMVGSVDNPARVITLVAGATTGNPRQLAGELEKARRIAGRTGAAVVVWQGYNPPPDLGAALSGAPATEGAGNLAAFQAALEERFPAAQKTVVAHSYGTLVATRAASRDGLLADDLWLLGSAGVDGGSVADLTLAGPEARVFVVDADRDPILGLRAGGAGALGANPSARSYGATAVQGVRGDHLDYFTDEAFLTALSQPPSRNAEVSVPLVG